MDRYPRDSSPCVTMIASAPRVIRGQALGSRCNESVNVHKIKTVARCLEDVWNAGYVVGGQDNRRWGVPQGHGGRATPVAPTHSPNRRPSKASTDRTLKCARILCSTSPLREHGRFDASRPPQVMVFFSVQWSRGYLPSPRHPTAGAQVYRNRYAAAVVLMVRRLVQRSTSACGTVDR